MSFLTTILNKELFFFTGTLLSSNLICFLYASDTNVKVTECDVSIRAEHRVFVNFFQHNISCNCTVTSLFDGELHINFTQTESGKRCYYSPYKVEVNDTAIKNCYGEGHAMFNVQTNDTVIIKVGYIENYYPMKITPCLEVYGKYNNRFV